MTAILVLFTKKSLHAFLQDLLAIAYRSDFPIVIISWPADAVNDRPAASACTSNKIDPTLYSQLFKRIAANNDKFIGTRIKN
jgi:hypothetical protein